MLSRYLLFGRMRANSGAAEALQRILSRTGETPKVFGSDVGGAPTSRESQDMLPRGRHRGTNARGSEKYKRVRCHSFQN